MRAKSKGFTLVEVGVVLLVLGLLLGVAMPAILHARAASQARNCIENLWQIEQAKEQYVMDAHLRTGDLVTVADIVPTYMTSFPICPGGGTYNVNPADINPTCSLAGEHTLANTGEGDDSLTITEAGSADTTSHDNNWYFSKRSK